MAFLGQEEQIREYQDRFKYFHIGLFIFIGILVVRLVFLQILSGDKLRQYSEANRIKRVRIAAPRGMIFDRNRNLLIDNRPAFDLEITPQYLKESKRKEEVIKRLSKVLSMSEKTIKRKLRRARNQPAFLPVKIKTDLSRDEVAKIETWKLDMPGVSVEMEIERTNLYGDTASHLLGYIGKITSRELKRLNKKSKIYKREDLIGKVGIEKEMENILRGTEGVELVEVDALGRRIRDEKKQGRVLGRSSITPAIPGKNLVLTIDQDLQLAAKKAFGEEKSGGLVAIDPRSGEILAMISRPSFDSTEFSRGISSDLWKSLTTNENRPLRDKTLQDHYSPGSVFKVVTALTALEDGVINEHTKFNCPGAIRMGNRMYHCHRRGGHGSVNLIEAIKLSCDVFFYRVAQKLRSVDQIAKWAKEFGLGRKTGIQLSREVPGLIPTEKWKLKRTGEVWTTGESLSVAIGQSFVLTTPIQLANLYAAIANGGTLFRPHFIKTIENADGTTVKEFEPEIIANPEFDPKHIEIIKKGLRAVVNEPRGTAYWQRLPNTEYAGKTGTVQLIRLAKDKIYQKCENMEYRRRHHGVFVGFAPIENPKISVAVIAEHSCSGSGGAAPIVRSVIKAYLDKHRNRVARHQKREKDPTS